MYSAYPKTFAISLPQASPLTGYLQSSTSGTLFWYGFTIPTAFNTADVGRKPAEDAPHQSFKIMMSRAGPALLYALRLKLAQLHLIPIRSVWQETRMCPTRLHEIAHVLVTRENVYMVKDHRNTIELTASLYFVGDS